MNINRVAAMVTSLAVLIVVIAAFQMVGTPAAQRLERLDERRIADLQTLAHALDAYHAQREALPDTLEPLVDGRRLSRLPTDPATETPYRYEVIAEDRYRLCASFGRASGPDQPPEAFWRHQTGETCFEFDAPDEAGPTGRPLPPY